MRVRALQECFVGRRWNKGEEGEYNGPKNDNLEPIKAAKPETVKEEAKSEKFQQ